MDGKPKVGMASKLRQCQKFVEVLSGLVKRINKEVKINTINNESDISSLKI